ncbi:MAG TPA: nucleotidyltransferase [Cyanothece sp. UBA12306]|nr:nucleotidyltransferase [Cyanothece sp. UBA12306]
MVVSCDKILRYSQGIDYKSFMGDELRVDATLRNLQIIGEAVKQVPKEMRTKYPRVEWRKIAGLRDILAHAYFSLEDETIWDIIQTKIMPLKSEVETIISQEFK